MPVVIKGLSELRKALRDAAVVSPRVVTAGLKVGAAQGAARSRELAPKATGKMASTIKPFSNVRGAGVKTNHPGAGVQNFATTYWRKGANGGPPQQVHLVNVSAFGANKDRFLYKALELEGPAMAETVFKQLVEVLKCAGWFEG